MINHSHIQFQRSNFQKFLWGGIPPRLVCFTCKLYESKPGPHIPDFAPGPLNPLCGPDLKYLVLYLQSSTSTLHNVVVPRYAVQGKCQLEKLTHQYGFTARRRQTQWKIEGAEGAHSSEPQKAHPTSEFIFVL